MLLVVPVSFFLFHTRIKFVCKVLLSLETIYAMPLDQLYPTRYPEDHVTLKMTVSLESLINILLRISSIYTLYTLLGKPYKCNRTSKYHVCELISKKVKIQKRGIEFRAFIEFVKLLYN